MYLLPASQKVHLSQKLLPSLELSGFHFPQTFQMPPIPFSFHLVESIHSSVVLRLLLHRQRETAPTLMVKMNVSSDRLLHLFPS